MPGRRTFIKLVETGTPQQVQTAIDQGEDVNAREKFLGWTALMYAARFNKNPEVITTLLKAGADINARDEIGGTALMAAAMDNQNPDVIITLLKAAADGKAKDDAGLTAFDHAYRNAKLEGTDALKQLEEASK
jgi:ankyrin repeat protein